MLETQFFSQSTFSKILARERRNHSFLLNNDCNAFRETLNKAKFSNFSLSGYKMILELRRIESGDWDSRISFDLMAGF